MSPSLHEVMEELNRISISNQGLIPLSEWVQKHSSWTVKDKEELMQLLLILRYSAEDVNIHPVVTIVMTFIDELCQKEGQDVGFNGDTQKKCPQSRISSR